MDVNTGTLLLFLLGVAEAKLKNFPKKAALDLVRRAFSGFPKNILCAVRNFFQNQVACGFVSGSLLGYIGGGWKWTVPGGFIGAILFHIFGDEIREIMQSLSLQEVCLITKFTCFYIYKQCTM